MISMQSLSELERDATNLLKTALGQLSDHSDNFSAALSLFDFSMGELEKATENRTAHPMFRWPFIAARDGAMSIYHFGKAMEGIMASLHKCPTVLQEVNRAKLRSSRKRLRELFPNFEAVRHSVAHAGELMNDVDDLDRHSISTTSVQRMTIQNHLQGRAFKNTFEGQIQSYEINQASRDGLVAIREEFCAAFKGVF
jgi:hypothetical protein